MAYENFKFKVMGDLHFILDIAHGEYKGFVEEFLKSPIPKPKKFVILSKSNGTGPQGSSCDCYRARDSCPWIDKMFDSGVMEGEGATTIARIFTCKYCEDVWLMIVNIGEYSDSPPIWCRTQILKDDIVDIANITDDEIKNIFLKRGWSIRDGEYIFDSEDSKVWESVMKLPDID